MSHLRIDDFCHVGPILGPKSRQLGRQWRHLGSQEPPIWPPRGPWELGTHDHFSQFLPRRPRRGGYHMGPWGKIWILERFSSKFGPILHYIWIDFDLDLRSDFALMLAPTRDA